MSRINTNVNSLIAQRISTQQSKGLQKSLERLSTGLAINRGADNPAGLIASEKLRSDKAQISAAIGNAERAEQVINIAEGGLGEIGTLLTELQGLVSETGNEAGLSTEEKEANQQQIDSILQTIDRIASTTSFQGSKLLNGSFEFQVSGVASTVNDYKVTNAKIAENGSVTVKAVVTASAQHAGLFMSAGGALNLGAATSSFTFELAGTKGTRQFSFASGTALADVATSINAFKDVTGVSAKASGTGIVLKTEGFGSSEFVSVNVTNDGGQAGAVHVLSSNNENAARTAGATAFASVSAPIRDDGQDVTAFINGVKARGEGKVASIDTDALSVELELTTAGATANGSITALTVAGGGAKFNLGPSIDLGNEVRVGLPNASARNLGSAAVGYLDSLRSGGANNVVDGSVATAQKVVNTAIDQVSSLRGRLGAVQNTTIGATIRSLGVAFENVASAEASIRDTDFAAETANLTRSQILVAAANSVLGIANNSPSSVLSLLG